MNIKTKKGFTLVELVAVLVILAIIALIVTPLVLTLINKARIVAFKRSVDAYGKSVEIGIMNYMLETGFPPTDLKGIKVEYTGYEVKCNVMTLNSNGSVYLSECSINNIEIKDDGSEDGWYHYGNLIEEQAKTAVDALLAKVNNVSVTTYKIGSAASHEMYTFEHDATIQTEALTDYRYIGSDPYNYVTFNNELWRIIGVFTVEDENDTKQQRIKIIRNENLGDYYWDYRESNEWTTASLNTYLNGTYYNSLTSVAQSMIAPTKFYLGGSSSVSGQSASSYYMFERGTTVYSGRSKNWTGKVGLMYPSDYVYTYAKGVDNECYTDGLTCSTSKPLSGWLYNSEAQWTISPVANYYNRAFAVRFTGYVGDDGLVGEYDGVRPSLYLSSEVQITEGNGSIDAPYRLKLN